MSTLALITICVLWLSCSVIAFGWWLAFFQREYSIIAKETFWVDFIAGLVTSLLFGPAALFANLMVFSKWDSSFVNNIKSSSRHGLMYRLSYEDVRQE